MGHAGADGRDAGGSAGVNAGLTGNVLELDEFEQSQKDTTKASVVALILSALIFTAGYHETGRPLKAVACLWWASATMGFATLVIGHLNILTITFVPILIRVGDRLRGASGHAMKKNCAMAKSEEKSPRRWCSPGRIFTGAFTTAGAFLAMGFTDFRASRRWESFAGWAAGLFDSHADAVAGAGLARAAECL